MYKRFMEGWSMLSVASQFCIYDWEVENSIRAYLKRRDARRKAK